MDAEKPSKKKNPRQYSSHNPKGVAFGSRKLLAEFEHSPGLVGSIVEKGFSSTSSSSSSATSSFPQPTVLPFPVARHRSHGPYRVPLSLPMVDADKDGMEEDKDDMDYRLMASYANPLEARKKKSDNFSNWREVVSGGCSTNARTRKTEAKKTEEYVDSHNTVSNGGERETLQSNSNFVGKAEKSIVVMQNKLDDIVTNNQSSPAVENMDVEAVMSISSSSPAIRSRVKPVVDDIEMMEHTGQGSRSLTDDIDAENLIRLNQMSTYEITDAQAEIMEKMDPTMIEMLKKRGRQKLQNKENIKITNQMDQKVSATDEPSHERKNAGAPGPPGDQMATSECNSSSWKAWSVRVENVRAIRFSLDGNILDIDSTQDQPNGEKQYVSTYAVEKVGERDILRTEGDPAAFGYTINEAVALARSMLPGQRAIAVQMLASILNKALHNLQQTDNCFYFKDKMHGEKLDDWEAIWAFALGPEPQMALALRIALDDNNDFVVLNSVKAIQCMLSLDVNENYFNIKEKLTAEKGTFSAPIFRSRPELDGGFLHGGYWKYNAKPSNIIIHYSENEEGNDNEEKPTIKDDVTVAGQDVVAGLVRMGILPRICNLLEMDPHAALEESLISVLIAIARHSPTCADAIMECPRLIETFTKIFTKQSVADVYQLQTKAIVLLKVLSQSSKEKCLNFVRRGIFQQAIWRWYLNPVTLEQWIKLGREHCKFSSILMVEQLRLWKTCIHYGFCIEYFTDFFLVLCLWLNLPSFDKLIENNLLEEFTSVSTEAYLVLEALAQRLPYLHSVDQLSNQGTSCSDVEVWSWSHVTPMVDLAICWLSLLNVPYASLVIDYPKKKMNLTEIASASCMIRVISAVLHMFCSILQKIGTETNGSMNKSSTPLPWLPEFVPKVALEIIKNRFFNFSDSSNSDHQDLSEAGSLATGLCHLRKQSDIYALLSAVSCLQGLVRVAILVDKSVVRAKSAISAQIPEGYCSGKCENILEEGITKWAQSDFSKILSLFVTILSEECQALKSVEVFGRGGPAPGIGCGWGTAGGGFWSFNVLLAQADAQLFLDLLKIVPLVPNQDHIHDDSLKTSTHVDPLALEKINCILGVCLLVGPGGSASLENIWEYLLQAPMLKYLAFCIHYYSRHAKSLRTIDFQYSNDDYSSFSKILTSHYKERWLTIKRKSSSKMAKRNHSIDMHRKDNHLETIDEEVESGETVTSKNNLLVEWVGQRLPLPVHWLLSAICVIGDSRSTKTYSPDVLGVAKGGLFLLLGLEAMSSLMFNSKVSVLSDIHIVWKLHALSMALHVNMDVLEDGQSRDCFETLQDICGQHLDKIKYEHFPMRSVKLQLCSSASVENKVNTKSGILNFQTMINGSYNTFIENVVEQFAAISYGEIIFGRQVAVYLHRSVDASTRRTVWAALSNTYALELLPPIEKCIGEAAGYMEPQEDNEEILEAYAKSWTSGGLDRAASRGSVSFTLAVHHLSSFLFRTNESEKISLRTKFVKSLLRTYSQKRNNAGMVLTLIRHGLPTTDESELCQAEVSRRFGVLKESCHGNSSLVAEVEKLKTCM